MASEFKVDIIKNLAGTGPVDLYMQEGVKARVNFNGTGTIAIREALNVSSLVDVSTGTYKLNLTGALSNVNYSVAGSIAGTSTGSFDAIFTGTNGNVLETGAVPVGTISHSGARVDVSHVHAQVIGDLA